MQEQARGGETNPVVLATSAAEEDCPSDEEKTERNHEGVCGLEEKERKGLGSGSRNGDETRRRKGERGKPLKIHVKTVDRDHRGLQETR